MVSIIGAGPCGSYLGYLLAKKGYKVDIYEQTKKIGVPVQCTGIVTSSIFKIIKPKPSFVINKINKTRVYSKNNFVELRLRQNLILDRTKFDQHLANMAKKQGANIHLNHRFLDYKKNYMLLENKGKVKRIKTNIIVGADGAMSQVAQACNMWKKRKFFIGMQARANLKNDNVVEFFLGLGDFAWIVPESKNIVRIGLVARTNPNKIFSNFLESKLGSDFKKKIISYQGGLVPVYNPKQTTQKNNVYLVGDAATMVKATTAGGIIQGLIGAQALADSIINKKNYQKQCKKRLGKDLYYSLLIRKMLDKFSEKDYNFLIKIVKDPGVMEMLEKYDRDYPSKFLFKLVVKEPRLLYFTRFLLSQMLPE